MCVRRFASALLVLGLAISSTGVFVGCTGEPEVPVFALVPKSMNNPFFEAARQGCEEAERNVGGFRCLYIGPAEHTEQEQVEIVQDLLSRRVAGIAISPSNAPAIARVLERVREAGIPVITWDSDLLVADQGLRASYVGTKNVEIGRALARRIAELKPEGGEICIQSGGPAAANHNERMLGLRTELAGDSSSGEPPGPRLTGSGRWIEVEGCPVYSLDDFPLAVQQLADVLVAHPDLDVFVATGGFPQFVDQAYRQVVEPLRPRLDDGSLVILAADTLEMQMELLAEGLSSGQVGQRPKEMGFVAMEVLAALHRGEEVDPAYYTGLDVCTSENLTTCLSGGG